MGNNEERVIEMRKGIHKRKLIMLSLLTYTGVFIVIEGQLFTLLKNRKFFVKIVRFFIPYEQAVIPLLMEVSLYQNRRKSATVRLEEDKCGEFL
ncbi:hypothetical protein [Bacillus sp. AFS018417]|uniref:hypothetical protein n=1 Tax=Bacillus sp. AFS018417 TaxID=2033491 RepID=UPI0015969E03|nr:hypothetical protein [Bacillus sp. AFS018417]